MLFHVEPPSDMGAHHIIDEIRNYQEKVVFKAGPWAKCLLADGYGVAIVFLARMRNPSALRPERRNY